MTLDVATANAVNANAGYRAVSVTHRRRLRMDNRLVKGLLQCGFRGFRLRAQHRRGLILYICLVH